MGPNEADLQGYEENGYALAKGMFSAEECDRYTEHYMSMIHRGGDGWAEGDVDPTSEDPLKRYPRLLQPHRGEKTARDYMLEPRIRVWLKGLLGEDPYAVQTMIYFKPPGARGQALHQDQRYLRVEPGTCMAAWLALDDTDEDNGCLTVVPGSNKFDMLCPGVSDPTKSFTTDEITPPPGMQAVPLPMKRGDVLFFNGSLIHGSGPNHSDTRFRRIIVGHYIAAEAEKVAHYYFPVFDMDGEVIDRLESNPWGGGPCGVMRETENGLVYELVGSIAEPTAAH
ncbi:phytanoyl-CoA dioxygenase family protein [bacterium]|nr:MAG: phytanoyl-CoA dioxygenase family protein [bacterium]